MNTICDGCGHTRGAAERGPQNECPACGRIYGRATAARERAEREAQRAAVAEEAAAMQRARQLADRKWAKKKICEACGWIGEGELADMKGSGWTEFSLYGWWILSGLFFFWLIVVPLVFLVLAVAYSVWRRVGGPCCPSCGAPHPLPVASLRGVEVAGRFRAEWEEKNRQQGQEPGQVAVQKEWSGA